MYLINGLGYRCASKLWWKMGTFVIIGHWFQELWLHYGVFKSTPYLGVLPVLTSPFLNIVNENYCKLCSIRLRLNYRVRHSTTYKLLASFFFGGIKINFVLKLTFHSDRLAFYCHYYWCTKNIGYWNVFLTFITSLVRCTTFDS